MDFYRIQLLYRSNNLSLWLNKEYLLAMPQLFNKIYVKYFSCGRDWELANSILSEMPLDST